ncbi:MAG: glycerophosphodiester phosphodiesterase family protein [Planctomycetota bacterium]|nr:glycerophosphodiester phosphodiesterase family protein [Planctomycetota bacterium]
MCPPLDDDLRWQRGLDPAPGPPWILGHRGSPWEAPENTLSGLRRALAWGLDGFEYDLQPTASGEAVLLHDETLGRTTSGSGLVRERGLPELFGLDAGSWFSPSFAGEPVPVLEEAFVLDAESAAAPPFQMIELKDPHLLGAVTGVLAAERFAHAGRPRPFVLASFHRSVCLEARDMGLATMLLGVLASESDRRFVRDERIDAYGTGPGGWRGAAGEAAWPCQRWSWSVDQPDDLLEAFRMPLFGLNTNEPRRALACRELVRLAPDDRGAYPVRVDELLVDGGGLVDEEPDDERDPRAVLEPWTAGWCGDWRPSVRLRNPFAWPIEVELVAEVRGGAFEFGGAALEGPVPLAVGESRTLELHVSGGSRSPGPDPRLLGILRWQHAGEPRELHLDAPLSRRRVLCMPEGTRRLELLREAPGEAPASITITRRGGELRLAVEDPGGLALPHLAARLGPELAYGGERLSLRLPTALLAAAGPVGGGIDFAVGFEGRLRRPGVDPGDLGAPRGFRRWCGGLSLAHGAGLLSGVPGRIVFG